MVERLDDETEINGTQWLILKEFAMKSNFSTQSWYCALSDADKAKVESLRKLEARMKTDEKMTLARRQWKHSIRLLFDF